MDRYIVSIDGVRLRVTSGSPTFRDLAVSHARTPMYCGHTRLFQSVAHHCLGAAELAQEAVHHDFGAGAVPYFTLLHELETAAFGDIPGPVKIQPQRDAELAFRLRSLEDFGTPLPAGIWSQVEFYDKVEQAAAAQWLGLAETVHSGVWASTPDDLKARAVEVTKRLYAEFPPREQLDADSPLVRRFLYQLGVYQAAYVGSRR